MVVTLPRYVFWCFVTTFFILDLITPLTESGKPDDLVLWYLIYRTFVVIFKVGESKLPCIVSPWSRELREVVT